MNLAENLRYYRKKFGFSQDQIAERLGYKSFTTIQKWEMGVSEPSLEKINTLANLFGVSIDHLISNNTSEPSTTPQYTFIPDAVAAGIPCTIEGRKDLPTIGISDALMGKYAGNKHIIIMKVNGESMNKVIPNGSFVAIKTDVNVENLRDGDLVVFGKTHEYSLKHFYNAGDKVIFKPNSTDPTFTDHVFDKDETIKIVGKVIMSIRNYN